MNRAFLIGIISSLLACSGIATAQMGNGPMMPGMGGTGPQGGGFAMGNAGGFGMVNGMSAAPVVGSEGTAYLVTYNPSTNPGPVPNSNSFQSTITAVTPSGAVTSITLYGIISRPVVEGDVLVATASLPDLNDFMVFANLGTEAPGGQSMAYVVPLPLTDSSVPVGVSLDGQFASLPVMANNSIYVVTSDFGNGMMSGNSGFNRIYGGYNFNGVGTARSYLYIIGFDGTLINKITIQ